LHKNKGTGPKSIGGCLGGKSPILIKFPEREHPSVLLMGAKEIIVVWHRPSKRIERNWNL